MYLDSNTVHTGVWMYIAVLNFRDREDAFLSHLVLNTIFSRAETPGISMPCDMELNTKRDKAVVS